MKHHGAKELTSFSHRSLQLKEGKININLYSAFWLRLSYSICSSAALFFFELENYKKKWDEPSPKGSDSGQYIPIKRIF